MTLQDSRSEYARRMHRVLAHIDRPLDQPLALPELAAVAHFSPFHFHRLFAAWMGETLGDYLRRRRLDVAALRLIAQPRTAVLPLALAVGYGSTEAFSRAFKLRFGCTPSGWRQRHRRPQAAQGQNSNPDQWLGNPDQAAPGSAGDDGHLPNPHPAELPMSTPIPIPVTLIDREPVHIAYMRHVGPYGQSVGAFWQREVRPWLQSHRLLGAPRYGMSHDDPSITDPARCRYDAAAEVPPDFVASGPVQTTVIPGGRCASLPFCGTSEQIYAACQALLRPWLAGSGLQLDARPCFEFYAPGSTYDAATGAFSCDIVVPVAPL